MTGIKHDEGKPPLELLDRIALIEAARVMKHGEERYGAYNWRKGLSQRRTLGAALRHLYAHLDGEDLDESGCLHLAHALVEISFAIRMHQTRPDLDDRYKEDKRDPFLVEEGYNDYMRAKKEMQKFWEGK